MAMFRNLRGANAVKERNFDRSFILFGKGCCGKSTLGNLLLGKAAYFKTHTCQEARSITKRIQTGEDKLKACQIYNLDNCKEIAKVQIIDQPGSNDAEFNQEKYCKFLMECIAESKAEMSATFLILVSLVSKFFSSEEMLTIYNLAEVLSDSNYSFFENAIVVFTHADKLDRYLNQENLEKNLKDKIKDESFAGVEDLIDLVDGRYIFINGANPSELNRYAILKELFQLSRSSLNVYINGNNGFKRKELKLILNEDANCFVNQLTKYDLNYQFNPDLNLFRKFEIHEVEEKVVNELAKLSGIGKGISTMVLLISLEELFDEEIYDLIMNLPETYNLGKEFQNNFWKYAGILFKVAVDKKEFVKQNVDKNRLLNTLVIKVNFRYAWITNETHPEECSHRLVELVKKVKLDTEGKSYTDKIVLAEMKKTIKEATQLKEEHDKSQMGEKIENARMKKVIPFYRSKEGTGVLVTSNKFFRNKTTISPLKGYFILRKIDTNIAEQFRERYKDIKKEISNEEYTEFCFKAIGML